MRHLRMEGKGDSWSISAFAGHARKMDTGPMSQKRHKASVGLQIFKACWPNEEEVARGTPFGLGT